MGRSGEAPSACKGGPRLASRPGPPLSIFPEGGTERRVVIPGRLPPALPRPERHRGRVRIGHQINGKRIQGVVEIAYRTDSMQVLTTLVWAGRLDALSQRILAQALRLAAYPDNPVRLQVFAALARDLFRHAVETLPPHPGNRRRRKPAGYLGRHGPSDAFIPKADTQVLHPQGDLLAAIDDLGHAARFRPHVTVADSAVIDRLMIETRSALCGLFASLGTYLEQAVKPLFPYIGRNAIHAFVLETPRELDDLAACSTAGAYIEGLSVTSSGGRSVGFEVEGSLGVTAP